MNRQNLFADVPWDSEDDGSGLSHRAFWRPDGFAVGSGCVGRTEWSLASLTRPYCQVETTRQDAAEAGRRAASFRGYPGDRRQ